MNMKLCIRGALLGLGMFILPVRAFAEDGTGQYENYSEEVRIFAEINDLSNVYYVPETGEFDGRSFKCPMEGSRWQGSWFSLLWVRKEVTKTYTVNGEPVSQTETSMISAYDQSSIDTETWETTYPEDYYYLKGSELVETAFSREMVFDPEPTITEVTVVYGGQEVAVPFTPTVATVTKAVPYHYTVMLKDESDASYYVEHPLINRREITGDAFANRESNDSRYDVLNFMEITGYGYGWNDETMEFERTVSDTFLEGCYGMDYDTQFDRHTVKPVAQAIVTFSGGAMGSYECPGTIELDGSVSFNVLEDGYLLQTSDNGRTVTGKITEEDGTEHDISVYLAVKGPTLYASYVVSIPASFTLEDLGNSFKGTFPIGVTIISNDEDFYVEVEPQETVLSGVLTGDVVRLSVTQDNRRFQIGPLVVPYEETTSYAEENVVVETEGRPERADTYSGTLSFTITSGTE